MQRVTRILIFLQLISFSSTILFSDMIQGASVENGAMECDGYIPEEFQNLSFAVYPDSCEYNTDRLNYNKCFNYFPKIIFYPKKVKDVQFLVKIFAKYCLEFAIRSGGHCFEPGSLSSHYIVDLSHFNKIIPDIHKQEVYIGAGCELKNVIKTLGELDYAIPTGTCPSVGVTGLTLGGGIGFLCRQCGLTCDSVKNIKLVNAEGEVIEVNEHSHPDLFWALRGGGNGSYGIVLGFTFKIHYVPEVTYYELMWEWDVNLLKPIMETWQSWAETLSDTTTTVLGVRHPNFMCALPEESPPLVIRIDGLKVGSEPFTEWKVFEKFHPEVKIIKTSYLDSAKYWSNESPLPFNKGKSKILNKPLKKKTINKIVDFFRKLENRNPNFLVYFDFERFGGQVASNNSSFFPSKAFGWWEQAYFWEFPEQTEEVIALSRQFYETLSNKTFPHCYANFVDYDLGQNYLYRYYGDHVDRLIAVKKKYDPLNLFHWKQSIPVDR